MTPKFFYSYFHMSLQNTQNFMLISNPWKLFLKVHPEKVGSKEEDKL